MKKWLIIIGGVVVLIIIIVVIALVLKPAAPVSTQGNQQGQTSFPSSQNVNNGNSSSTSTGSNSNSGGLPITTSTGNSITVKNFENTPTTVKDPSGDGYYYVAGGANVNTTHAPYQIFYDSQHQYFGITLYKEPLGQYRTQAEDELMQELGISQQQMCSLNYDVSAGPGINDLYSSENIGFSFCPGAVPLPQ